MKMCIMLFLLPFLILEQYSQADDLGPINDIQNLDSDTTIIVSSKDFPTTCCSPETYQINYIGAKDQFIRIEFTDLDIPLGSTLELLDSNDEPIPEQPKLFGKTYIRKGFAFTGNSVKIVFKPIGGNKPSEHYSGFRAEVTSVNTKPTEWDLWPTSERCEPVNDVMVGGRIKLQNRSSSDNFSALSTLPIHDCIWVFKMPPEFESSGQSDVQLFLRLDELDVAALVRRNFSLMLKQENSEGKLIKLYDEETMSETDPTPETFTSSSDLYVRLRLPYTTKTGTKDDHYTLDLKYGIFSSTNSTTNDCKFATHLDGFNCVASKWCVPYSYRCNALDNCPDAEDEKEKICYVKKEKKEKPTTTTTAKPPECTNKYKRKCSNGNCMYTWERCPDECLSFEKVCKDRCISSWETCKDKSCVYPNKLCDDGRCISTWDYCNGCSYSWQRKCSDGLCVDSSDRCSDEPCSYYYDYSCLDNSDCLYSSSQCNDYCDCTDCSDENNCESNSQYYWLILLAVLGVIVSCCSWLCKKKKQADSARGGQVLSSGQPTAAYTSGTPMQPVVTGSTPNSQQPRGYQSVPTNPIVTATGPQYEFEQPTDPTAPPEYTDALDTNQYPVPPPQLPPPLPPLDGGSSPNGGLPPPPSYDTVVTPSAPRKT